jgi:hypothetical protein
MKDLEGQVSSVWNEASWRKFKNKNRNEEIEPDVFEEDDSVLSYGLYEDLTLNCGYGVEDWNEIYEEFNE